MLPGGGKTLSSCAYGTLPTLVHAASLPGGGETLSSFHTLNARGKRKEPAVPVSPVASAYVLQSGRQPEATCTCLRL